MYDLLIGADFYKTLNVDHDVSPEEVRRAYYHLAKEIHPDRFLAAPLDVLHAKMEELFSQVLEAYHTLGSLEARARDDTERAQAGAAPKVATSDQQMLAKQNFVRGRMLVDENKPAEALKWLQNAVDVEPNKPEYQLARGCRLRTCACREAEEPQGHRAGSARRHLTA
jgi:curved DNA-binding protein CbpA